MKIIKLFMIGFVISIMTFVLVGCGNNSNDVDSIKPIVTINNPTTSKAGVIKIDYDISDNVTPVDKLIVDIVCVKDGLVVEVINDEFYATEGVYTIMITATDEAKNKGTGVIDITVTPNEEMNIDKVKPILFVNIPAVAYVGEEVIVEYTVSDNETLTENIFVEILVTKDGDEISLDDNKFIVEEGNYQITIKATDEASNTTIMVCDMIGKIDDVSPVVEIKEIDSVSVGDVVNVNYTAVDNCSSLENLNVEMVLSRGDVCRNVSNEFMVVEEGEYILTITVLDEEDNICIKSINFNVIKTREDRILSTEAVSPTNETTVDEFIDAEDGFLLVEGDNFIMKSDGYNIVFVKNQFGYYVDFINQETKSIMFTIPAPIAIYFRVSKQFTALYENIEITRYGIKASGLVESTNGSVVSVVDYYYYPDNDDVSNAINIQREINVIVASSVDKGYQSVFAILTVDNNPDNLDWFIPSNVFGEFDHSVQSYKVYRETLTGLPMVLFRDSSTGYGISLARYQPVIDYSTNSFACVGAYYGENSITDNASSIEINYPTRDTARRYFDINEQKKIVYDMTIMANKTESFDDAYIDFYNKQYLLEDVRIVNTDIEEVYQVINEDFKSFFTSKSNKGYISYGIPVPITIETGKLHGCSWQAGFTGQQLACAYNMMVYGLKYNDDVSLENGIKILNFWVNDIKMVNEIGVPKTWWEGYYMEWLGNPAFTRMVVDAMEALFDAYRLAVANGIEVSGWIESVIRCADWLVSAQNSDGSWYRCYNYEGTIYRGDEPDIPNNPGDVARPSSKNNSTMPVRFLGKIYEYTKDTKYLDSVKKAGEFIYKELYPKNLYIGGTIDNADCIDKEAGVFAMYAYDTLYTLTGEQRWLECLEQATIFTMSTVITVSFKVNPESSDLKCAYPLELGYSDGLSYITCNGTAVDNYAAYIYYQLFRLYVHTGKDVYYKMSEFIQQNTKSTMDWDGALNYPYKSLVAEASTVYAFGYSAAVDGDGVQGMWLPWQSVANGEPIAKMLDTFNVMDVKDLKDVPIEELRAILKAYGVGGNPHRKF